MGPAKVIDNRRGVLVVCVGVGDAIVIEQATDEPVAGHAPEYWPVHVDSPSGR